MWTNPYELAQAQARWGKQQQAAPAMPQFPGMKPGVNVYGTTGLGKGAGGTNYADPNRRIDVGNNNGPQAPPRPQQSPGFGGGFFGAPPQQQRQQQPAGQPMQVQNFQQMPPVFNQQQTQDASNRAFNSFQGVTPQMLMSQAQRPGIRADSMLPSVMPQYAQAQASANLAQQMIPFQHAQANAQNQLGIQNQQWLEALGFGNAALNAQNQLNQFQLGNMNSLADFFRLFL